jgi:hypothetical protein
VAGERRYLYVREVGRDIREVTGWGSWLGQMGFLKARTDNGNPSRTLDVEILV